MTSREDSKRVGFTLIELLIVVTIIAILASLAIPKYGSLLRKSQEGASKGNLGSLRSAINIYYSDMEGLNPYDITSLTINGKYLAQIPILRVPPYHGDTTNLLQFGGGDGARANCEQSGNDSWGFITTMAPTGGYAGCAGSADLPFAEGFVFVACTHTDSFGSMWTKY